MAEPLDREAQYRWISRHSGLREAGWAAMFCHLNRTERQELRKDVERRQALNDTFAVFGKDAEEFRRRFFVALTSLDLIDDDPPTLLAQKQAAALIQRLGAG